MSDRPNRGAVRNVGTCSHCGTAVLLRVRSGRYTVVREARCACGSTVIGAGLSQGLGRAFVTAVRR